MPIRKRTRIRGERETVQQALQVVEHDEEADQESDSHDAQSEMTPQVAGLSRNTILHLQHSMGNRAVARMLGSSTTSTTVIQRYKTALLGSNGEHVLDLQQKLNKHKASDPPLKEDSIFGPKTLAAVHAFQKSKGLTSDGIVGEKTWAALNIEVPAPVVDPPALASDELVLTTDPNFAKSEFVDWFKGEVKQHLEKWGLAPDPSLIEFKKVKISGVAKDAVILKWKPAWGPRPVATNISFSMEAIDAKAAVGGMQALPGWAKVPGGDKTILTNVVGGETNDLSVATRNNLRGKFASILTMSEDDQAKALKALIADKGVGPGVVAEQVNTAKIEYELEGPVAKKDYAFRGITADAEEWTQKFKDGVQLVIVAPKAPTVGHHNHTVQQAADSASYLPKSARSVINTILLNAVTNPDDPHWAVEYNTPDFHSYMTAGAAGVVTIYPDKSTKDLPDDNYRHGTMIHETGHTWSYKKWGTKKDEGKWLDWKSAMDSDKVFVSDYARASIAEDVAETIQVYVSAQNTEKFEEYRKIVPKRFDILDKEYKP